MPAAFLLVKKKIETDFFDWWKFLGRARNVFSLYFEHPLGTIKKNQHSPLVLFMRALGVALGTACRAPEIRQRQWR